MPKTKPQIFSLSFLFVMASLTMSCGSNESTDPTANLPPDPGEAGRTSVAGVDSDNDGVRDDVQRYIAFEHKDSERTRKALSSYALVKQNSLLEVGDAESARANAKKLSNAIRCILNLYDDDEKTDALSEEIESVVVNTSDRMRAAKSNQTLISGMIFIDDERPINRLCGFDPTKLAN